MKKILVTLSMSLSLLVLAIAGDTKVVDVSPKQVAEMLAKKEAPQVIDARTAEEFSEGHIKGAVVIDVTAADFEEKLDKLDRDKTYILHCRSGGRSARALEVFKKLEFHHVYHMNQGMLAWKKAGQPTVKE